MKRFKQYLNESDEEQDIIDACINGYLDVIKDMFAKNQLNRYNLSLGLRLASKYNHLDIVKYLIEKGANVNDRSGESLSIAISTGNTEIVKYLVEKGANSNLDQLREAINRAHLDIVKILVNNGTSPNGEPLDCALWHYKQYSKIKSSPIIRYLFSKGACLDTETNVPEEFQEEAIKNNPNNIRFISNLRKDLKDKHSHLGMYGKFGVFDDN